MDLNEVGYEGVGCHVAQDKDRWRATVNTVMNFRVPQNDGNSLSVERRFAS
jgi:hypothetical protein